MQGIRFRKTHSRGKEGWAALFWLSLASVVAPTAHAALYTVTTTADAGSGSLRDALAQAQASADLVNTIWFAPALDGQTITLTTFTNPPGSGAPNAVATRQFGPAAFFIHDGKSIIIDGAHRLAHGVVIARAADNPQRFRLFDIDTGSALALRGVTLRGGYAKGGDAGLGGGALGAGGAIFNRGTLSIENSTLDANTAQGGAVRAASSATGGGGVGGDATANDGGGPNGGTLSAGVGWGGGGRIPSDPPQFGGGGSGLGAPGSSGSSGGAGGFGAGSGGGPTAGVPGFAGGSGCASGGGSGGALGGAIFNDGGTLAIGNSTLTGNLALGGANERCSGATGFGYAMGGAVFNYNGRLSVRFSTLAGNAVRWGLSTGASGRNDGGAIYSLGNYACAAQGNVCERDRATLLVADSIVADNTYDSFSASSAGNDIYVGPGAFALLDGQSVSAGEGNMIGHQEGFAGHWLVTGQSPQLGALADNGGPAWTLLPAAASPVIDRIDPAQCAMRTDQRGVTRPQGSHCDIGAVEYRSAPQLSVSVSGAGSVSAAALPAPGSGAIAACTASGGSCTATYAGEGSAPQTVTLTASAAMGANFVGWGGDCTGSAVTSTVTLDASRSCQAQFTAAPVYQVTASVSGGHGGVSPDTQAVEAGGSPVFALLPAAGYRVGAVSGTCGGTLDEVGGTFTTSPVHADCTVVVHFVANLHEVVAVAGAGGAVAPAQQSVIEGGNASLAVSPLPGFHVDAIGGTCASGSLSGSSYVSGAVVDDCTITVAFAPNSYTVSAGTDGHGSISPASQTVAEGASATFTLLADPGYHIAGVDGSCGGQLNATSYTTAPVSGNCTVQAHFARDPSAALALSVCVWNSDGTCTTQDDYAAYGDSRLYVVTVSNSGAAAASDVMIAAGSLDLDAAATSWVCVGAVGASCTDSGSGPLSDHVVSVPAGGSLSWLVASRVRNDAPDAALVYQATLSRISAPVPQNAQQTAWLVIFRDGFESHAAAVGSVFDAWSGAQPYALRTPAVARDGLHALLSARAGDGAGFRVEWLCAGAACWLRLVVIDPTGGRASRWQMVDVGAEVQLHQVQGDDAGLSLLVAGATLFLPLHTQADGWLLSRDESDQ